ncbi:BQ5605_C018g08712 [Microbotryum silenes-dioicae]|uniref:BQ5605_C018g08712 protein n=1 Tax=Microbotryum silenes-dioicae TaxID=796604 RepID=A0A2X0MIL4_9BASI|nr:BQ5605_C018g08712 [Microbotryum silenes-dioicae]
MATVAPNASLLRFSLVPPLSTSTSPTACLVARLDLRQRSTIVEPRLDRLRSTAISASTSAILVEELRFASELTSVEVYRILDPGNKEPFVSLSRIFLACQISPIEGLMRFKLVRPTDYDSSLGGIAPFRDIWVPLKLAASIANELHVADELSALLEWSTRKAFTVEDKEEGGIVHNWKISSDRIDPVHYSTSTMLSTRFPRVHLLPSGNQVRTLMPSSLPYKAPPGAFPSSFDELWSHTVTWSIQLYEEYLEVFEIEHDDSVLGSVSSGSSTAKKAVDRGPPDLTPSFVFSSLFTLLSLMDELPTATRNVRQRIGNSYELPNGFKLSKGDLLGATGSSAASTNLRSKLALVDAISRLVAKEWRLSFCKRAAAKRNHRSQAPGDGSDSDDGVSEDRDWVAMRHKVDKIERELAALSDRAIDVASPLRRGDVDITALQDGFHTLSSQVSQLEHRLRILTSLTSYPSSASATSVPAPLPALEGEGHEASRTKNSSQNLKSGVAPLRHQSSEGSVGHVVPWLVLGAVGAWTAYSYYLVAAL